MSDYHQQVTSIISRVLLCYLDSVTFLLLSCYIPKLYTFMTIYYIQE